MIVMSRLITLFGCGIPLLCLILLGIALVRDRGRRRQSSNGPPLCDGCGYNLTGNASGVCPECGRSLRPATRPDSKSH